MPAPIIVIAGTHVDTQMGVKILEAKGLECAAYPVSVDPVDQTLFQTSSMENKHKIILELLRTAAAAEGSDRVFVYCNSLSASVDFKRLEEETGLKIVTPMDVYVNIAPLYKRLAVIAANAQGCAGIERNLVNHNASLKLVSLGYLDLVLAIEENMEPAELVETYRLPQLAAWFEKYQVEALILGCTHFPYFKKELSERIKLPLIDPAEEMISMLLEK